MILYPRSFLGLLLAGFTLVMLPLVVPPVVTGLVLLKLFGRNGPLGGWLADRTGGARITAVVFVGMGLGVLCDLGECVEHRDLGRPSPLARCAIVVEHHPGHVEGGDVPHPRSYPIDRALP